MGVEKENLERRYHSLHSRLAAQKRTPLLTASNQTLLISICIVAMTLYIGAPALVVCTTAAVMLLTCIGAGWDTAVDLKCLSNKLAASKKQLNSAQQELRECQALQEKTQRERDYFMDEINKYMDQRYG